MRFSARSGASRTRWSIAAAASASADCRKIVKRASVSLMAKSLSQDDRTQPAGRTPAPPVNILSECEPNPKPPQIAPPALMPQPIHCDDDMSQSAPLAFDEGVSGEPFRL